MSLRQKLKQLLYRNSDEHRIETRIVDPLPAPPLPEDRTLDITEEELELVEEREDIEITSLRKVALEGRTLASSFPTAVAFPEDPELEERFTTEFQRPPVAAAPAPVQPALAEPCTFERYCQIRGAVLAWARAGRDVNESLERYFGITSLDWARYGTYWVTRAYSDAGLSSKLRTVSEEFVRRFSQATQLTRAA
jgi:hypothetical protein